MINCRSCNHPRLIHDSWGCKMQCSCGVSIIYMTPLLREQADQTAEAETINAGNLLVRQADRRAESRIEEAADRGYTLEEVPAEPPLQ